jgi:ABC-type multidrug transport system ATPase subunit
MIKVEGLVKKYKNFSLKEASFILPEGKITALIGPNGAGKSTIIKILSSLKEADGGRLLLDDREVKDLSKTVDFGYMS